MYFSPVIWVRLDSNCDALMAVSLKLSAGAYAHWNCFHIVVIRYGKVKKMPSERALSYTLRRHKGKRRNFQNSGVSNRVASQTSGTGVSEWAAGFRPWPVVPTDHAERLASEKRHYNGFCEKLNRFDTVIRRKHCLKLISDNIVNNFSKRHFVSIRVFPVSALKNIKN